ncbi:MAG: TonB-dependent receptor [Bacteroidota bacterium]
MSFDYADIPLANILLDLEQKYGVHFSYANNLVQLNQRLTAHVKNSPLSDALNELFKGTKLSFLFIANQWVIKEASHAKRMNKLAPKCILSGYIRDSASGEALVGASVFVKELAQGAVTNGYGFYSLSLPAGNYGLTYSYVGYLSQASKIALTADQVREVNLSPAHIEMQQVEVLSTPADDNVKSSAMSINKLDIRTVKTLPALLGEADIVRSIQLLPGVSTVGEGATGFNVRGGGIDQNLIQLDEAPVYNSSHLFGFFSLFNPDAVKDISLLKGGIPAQYGGRLSSLLDIRMKEGNAKRLTTAVGLGTLAGRLCVEAPLIKDKSSFIVAARRSYVDWLMKLASALGENRVYFYDLSAKVNYTLNSKNKIYLSGYFGEDVFKFFDQLGIKWGNATGTVRWNHLFSPQFFANFTGHYGQYNYGLTVPQGINGADWQSNIINYSAKADFTYYLNNNNTLNFGERALIYQFQPGAVKPLGDKSFLSPYELDRQHAIENAFYINNAQILSTRLSVQYGLRLSIFALIGAATIYDFTGSDGFRKQAINPRTFRQGQLIQHYSNLEPRASARYSLTESSSLKCSYNRMAQYIHLISNTIAATPLDVWSPSTNNIKPQLVNQVTLGYFKNFSDNAYELSVEGFYKAMSNQIDYINGAELLLNKQLEGELLYGKGRAYGAEFFLKKNTGKLSGWVSYTLSRSERQINGINNDAWYAQKYDRIHNLSVVGMYALSERWTLAGNFAYMTGIAFSTPNGRYEIGGITVPHNTGNLRNHSRVPSYHRLDITATLKNRKLPKRRWESEWVFSLYNVYARSNAFTVYFRQNADDPTKTEAVRLSLLGTILPSITYNFKF